MKKTAVSIAVGFLIAAVIISSCGSKPSQFTLKPKPFFKVSVPMYIASQEAAYDYIVSNYWDRFLDSSKVFSKDTSLIGGVAKQDFMAAYSEYAQILLMVSPQRAFNAQKKLITKAESLKIADTASTVFNNLVSISEMVLYGVNSNLRSEELYLPIALALSTSTLIDSTTQKRYAKEAALCSLNRIGETATDFKFTTKEGENSSLHKIKSEYTLMFFSNPGCTACKEIIDALKGSEKIDRLEVENRLKVLNIYIDEDLTEWFKYMPIYPSEWINAYNADFSIRTLNLYDVRAIPSLYLLDSEKRVIFKDAPMMMVLSYLENA
jgi:thiol-disulfide isomerase/thioredoxin